MRSNKIETILMGIALIMLTIAMLVVAMFSYTDNVALAYKQGEEHDVVVNMPSINDDFDDDSVIVVMDKAMSQQTVDK